MPRIVKIEEIIEPIEVFDITVEVDESFIVADAVLHNCPACAGLDRKRFKTGEPHPSLPIHHNCRCVLLPVTILSDLVEEQRPMARSDFMADAKRAYEAKYPGKKWEDLSESTRKKYYYQAMRDYERTTGQSAYTQVSGGMNFKEYFQNEMTDQQRQDWLGPEKFKLWKRGRLPLDSFIPPYPDRAMTVKELKRLDQESFAKVPILEKAKTVLSALKPKEKTPEELKQEHKKKRLKQLERARKNRLKREADLVGAKLIKGAHSIEDDLKATSPNFVQGQNGVWERNCQRCVTAYEMRRRGIDVEALPREADRDGFATLMKNGDLNPDGYIGAIYKNAKLVKIPAQTQEQCKTDIQNKMAEFGDGSRAIVRVRWDPQDGHVFIAEQVNGQTRFIDPQPGREDVSWYFSQIKPAETCLIRVDNLKFDAKVSKCAKPR